MLDATVSTTAVVRTLFDHLPANGSELVLFDLNRQVAFSMAFKPADRSFLRTLFTGEPRAYRLAIVTNATSGTSEAVEKSAAPGSGNLVEAPTGLEYPPGVFSLSHIAVPFPINDPLYGLEPDQTEFYGIRLGSNPFYPYLEKRVLDWLD